jgi:hypothetical protein
MSTESNRYTVNPVVSCREESPEGALLFNPDTDDVLVINVTGLLIWEALVEPRTEEEVVEALLARCDNVPGQSEVADDVREFVEQLVEKDFVGTVGEA